MSDDDGTPLTLSLVGGIDRIDAVQWDACAGGNPFVRHGFLSALEQSRSAVGETGWLPRHLVVKDGSGQVLACAPLYAKSHSHGEYVFDWGWAEAYTRAGGKYYPKLQCSVPFSPVPGPRLLVRPGLEDSLRPVLATGLVDMARRLDVSSLHVTFASEQDVQALEMAGCLPRLGYQYHWHNQGYGDFNDFLGALSSRKRKQIKREREAVAALGLSIKTLVGADITPWHWDHFHRMYEAVVDGKWGHAYLTRDFFDHLSASSVGEQVVLIWVEQDGRPLAGAFNILGDGVLHGRNWGAMADLPFLHFEVCYYRALDFAVAHGLARVEAGAQGEHKVSRGYMPVATHSAHWLADPGFRDAVAGALQRERMQVMAHMAEQQEAGPYRES